MIWDRLSILMGFVPFAERTQARRRARRWSRAAKADDQLAIDLIQLGGIMVTTPSKLVDGWPAPTLPDPQQRDYERGRRDLALQLLALMNLTPHELNSLMKEPDYEPIHDDY